jgi:hypothetical protein
MRANRLRVGVANRKPQKLQKIMRIIFPLRNDRLSPQLLVLEKAPHVARVIFWFSSQPTSKNPHFARIALLTR